MGDLELFLFGCREVYFRVIVEKVGGGVRGVYSLGVFVFGLVMLRTEEFFVIYF